MQVSNMNRKEFVQQSFVGLTVLATGVGLAQCLGGCTSSTAPADVDITLDLTAPENAALKQVGGSLRTSGIIVACVGQDSYVAVQSACTHEGQTITWQQGENRFYCPEHGATFARTGAVTKGPAKVALASYKTTLNGSLLRISS
jgi:cytochrome b6-f complex iron-sulfur subunit